MGLFSAERWEKSQSDLNEVGKYGCLFLCLISCAYDAAHDAGRDLGEVDVLTFYRRCRERKWLEAECYVSDSLSILNDLLPGKWEFRTSEIADIADDEYSVEKWVWGTATHFKRRPYDVWQDSQTVANGRFLKYYVYRYREA